MRKLIAIIVLLLLGVAAVHAHGEETFAYAEKIITDKIPCSELSEEQLEILGDYYMEQMHPGEAHEAMDEMIGGEGSESLRQMHINMGRSFYCRDGEGMMGDGGMMGSGGMMGGGMMSGFGNMMGNYYSGYGFFSWIFMVLIIVALVLLIVWLIKQIQSKEKSRSRRK